MANEVAGRIDDVWPLTPIIRDQVYIGPGAKIFGGIKIGQDVTIGANDWVTKDVPDNAGAMGVPARIISYEGSRDFVIFRNVS